MPSVLITVNNIDILPGIDNPKSKLQYALLKMSYRIEEHMSTIVPVLEKVRQAVKETMEQAIKALEQFSFAFNSSSLEENLKQLQEAIERLQTDRKRPTRPIYACPTLYPKYRPNTHTRNEIRSIKRRLH